MRERFKVKIALIILVFMICIVPIKAESVENLEFKGVWFSTVYNIDWDKSNGQATYKKDLDIMKSIGLNTVVFQVRSMGDAFYKTNYAPWSKYITGTLGRDPGYDPLRFAVDEAKSRGLKFHAWFNPFRISSDPNFNLQEYLDVLPVGNQLKNNPQWIVKYEKYHWINIGEVEARNYVIEVIKEVVRNYNIDGVHIDDYFYPYPVAGVDFPDNDAYSKYGQGFSSKADWRRDNVNNFVRDVNHAIKSIKGNVDFGISPFGIWKNSTSEGGAGTQGLSSYNDLYCDTVKFINNGWIDYVIPQIYWDFSNVGTPYGKLTDWWASKTQGKSTKLYIGHAAYKEFSSEEIKNQIVYNKNNSVVRGSCFYSMRDIRVNSRNLQDQIKGELGISNSVVPKPENVNSDVIPVPKPVENNDESARVNENNQENISSEEQKNELNTNNINEEVDTKDEENKEVSKAKQIIAILLILSLLVAPAILLEMEEKKACRQK